MTFLRTMRIKQIRIFASLLNIVGRTSVGRWLIVGARDSSLTRPFLYFLLGYRRAFPSFDEAKRAAEAANPLGHRHPEVVEYHSSIADVVRESDYPVLFYLAPIASGLRRVFDFGGNVGNVFYAYQHCLEFHPDLLWLVYDLPSQQAACEALAKDRGESRIRFVNNLEEASGSDLFLSSGSLHYFHEPLSVVLGRLTKLPQNVIVNRTPCSKKEDLYAVQDNGSYMVPCKIHDRAALIDGMQRLGYKLRASWPAYERHLWVATHPDLSEDHYSGFFFQLQK